MDANILKDPITKIRWPKNVRDHQKLPINPDKETINRIITPKITKQISFQSRPKT